jgi:SpoIID/LytB domain protein
MATMAGEGGSGSAGTGGAQGLVLTQNGKAIPAYFHSSSGGRTQDPAEVWGSSVGFTSVVEDPWALDPSINPYASWTASVAQQRVAQVFGLPAVSSLEVISRTASGAVKEIRATAPTGTATVITGAAARAAFGLRSTHLNAIGPSGAVVNAVVQPGFNPGPGGPVAEPAAVPQAGLSLQVQSPASVKVGAQVKLGGTLSPKQARVTVLRQRQIGKKWQTVGKSRTNAAGEYRMAFKLPVKGTYTYRTVILNKRKKVSKVSESISISAGVKNPGASSCKAGGCECPTCAGTAALPVAKVAS